LFAVCCSATDVTGSAVQDLIPHNHCYGCGPNNDRGLRIKSYWDGTGFSVATFTPQAHHCAGPEHFLNGGILATIVDCHCVCTAMAAAYLDAGRSIGDAPHLHFATSKLELTYQRPTPVDGDLVLSASIVSATERSYVLSCSVTARNKITVEAMVEAVRVPEQWMQQVRD
jgi:acyl-coenzyme A thioesterase PaaI-like protein